MSDNLKLLAFAILLGAMPLSAACAGDDTTYAVLHPGEPALAADQGRIYLYREGGLMGAALQPTIMINGESAGGRAKPGDYFYIDRPAGNYVISTTTEKEESTNITVVAGQPIYVRFDVSMGLFAGHVSPSIIDPLTAADEIKDCDYHAPKAAADSNADTGKQVGEPASDTKH